MTTETSAIHSGDTERVERLRLIADLEGHVLSRSDRPKIADMLRADAEKDETIRKLRTRWMPIMGTPFAIQLDMLDEAQARANHGGQSLQRLAERGGLDLTEALAIHLRREWRMTEESDAFVALINAALAATASPAPDTKDGGDK